MILQKVWSGGEAAVSQLSIVGGGHVWPGGLKTTRWILDWRVPVSAKN